jgi:hypothetical protein
MTMALTREEVAAVPEAETTRVYDENVKQFLGQRAGIFAPQGSISDLVLGVRTDLRRATDALEKAISERTATTIAERTLQSMYHDEKVAATARFHAGGLNGSNQAARDADLAVKLLADPDLRGLAKLVDGATRRRIESEGYERQCDISHKALRVELAALGALAGN